MGGNEFKKHTVNGVLFKKKIRCKIKKFGNDELN